MTIQKLASQPSNSLIFNLTPHNRIPFSQIMFPCYVLHELSTSYLTRVPFKISASAIYLSQHDSHDFQNIFCVYILWLLTRIVPSIIYYIMVVMDSLLSCAAVVVVVVVVIVAVVVFIVVNSSSAG